ncbi:MULTISPECIES: DUF805 domain-containing protein [unclassified Afipia]|uniref:DUF805 domain-containing protein n=1 Tax=unclassified Afipia TaxID=2642050 RepID=UPI0003FC409D|nr:MULTISPECIES: DUF805 domain-containing protein [unclassified Afipia]
MDLITLLFYFSGRISRIEYWLSLLFYLLVAIILLTAVFWFGGDNHRVLFKVIAIPIVIAGSWSGFAVGIKRLHDRNKSGWWIGLFLLGPSVLSSVGSSIANSIAFLFYFAGSAISIWALVELGFLRGTRGPNKYGAEPFTDSDTIKRI